MTTRNPVATGLSHGHPDKVGHVERAVNSALEKAGASHANSVLLFLTPDYAHDPATAIRAAARTAGCTQVTGATGSGLLTDQEWVLDSSGAAAMVFTGRVHLGLSQQADPNQLRLCLCTPQAVSSSWLDEPINRFGAITSDEFGHGPFAVWTSGAVVKDEFTEVTINGASAEVVVARGVRVLTAPMQVDEVKGLDVHRIANHPALHVLISALPEAAQRQNPLPLHMVMCGTIFGDPDTAIEEERFRLDHIVAADPERHSVTLSHPLRPGERLFWAMRDSVTAEHTVQESARDCRKALGGVPDFTIMFPCLSRGPLFFGGSDKDLAAARESFPGAPIIGFYGNGEIAPLGKPSHLHQYSTVLAAFRCHDA